LKLVQPVVQVHGRRDIARRPSQESSALAPVQIIGRRDDEDTFKLLAEVWSKVSKVAGDKVRRLSLDRRKQNRYMFFRQ
jgi:hypothetical protein